MLFNALNMSYCTDLLSEILWNISILFIPRTKLLNKLKSQWNICRHYITCNSDSFHQTLSVYLTGGTYLDTCQKNLIILPFITYLYLLQFLSVYLYQFSQHNHFLYKLNEMAKQIIFGIIAVLWSDGTNY